MKTIKIDNKRKSTGFTMLELLVVITIIVLLAGISISVFQRVQGMQDEKAAESDVNLLANAIQAYHLATGNYPGAAADEFSANSANGEGNTSALYMALYGDLDGDGETDDGVENFLPQLNPKRNERQMVFQSGDSYELRDPWGNEYFYRLGDGTVGGAADNPDFDLWSSGPDGEEGDPDTDKDNIVL